MHSLAAIFKSSKQRNTQMNKLLRTYHANPTWINALKIKHYNQKHPMAVVMLIGFETTILKTALEHAEKREEA